MIFAKISSWWCNLINEFECLYRWFEKRIQINSDKKEIKKIVLESYCRNVTKRILLIKKSFCHKSSLIFRQSYIILFFPGSYYKVLSYTTGRIILIKWLESHFYGTSFSILWLSTWSFFFHFANLDQFSGLNFKRRTIIFRERRLQLKL